MSAGSLNVTPGSQLLLSVSGKRVPTARITSASTGQPIRGRRPPEPDHAEELRMVRWQDASSHQRVRHRRPDKLGEAADLGGGAARAATREDQRPLGLAQLAQRSHAPLPARSSAARAARRGRLRPRRPRRGCPSARTRAPGPAGRRARGPRRGQALEGPGPHGRRATPASRRVRRLTIWSASRRRLNSWCGPRPS